MTPFLSEDLERDEGLRLKPYTDTVGKLTIGIGRNLDDVGISEVEARMMLQEDIRRAGKALDSRLPWWRTMADERQDVLLNMAFNLGIGRLLGFKDALAKMQAKDWAGAASELLDSTWAKQVGARATRLAEQMRRGVRTP